MKTIPLSLLSICFLLCHQSLFASVEIAVTTDRETALYQVGETVEFLIEVKDSEGEPVNQSLHAITSYDGGKMVFSEQDLDYTGKPLRVRGTLKMPGFLRCEVSFKQEGKTYKGIGSAGFDLLKVQSVTPEPDDFIAFWESGRKRLAAIPVDPQLKHLPDQSDELQDSYEIAFANLDGGRIYGYLSVPKGRTGPFPAYVHIASAGVGVPPKPESSRAAKDGVIVLNMSIHNLELGQDPEIYRQLSAEGGGLHNYYWIGAPDREAFYFRKVILGLDRAITYLHDRPDFNKKNLVVYGGSQGGGLTLILSGFNPHITAAVARVPALCDHWGVKAGRRSGWPRIVTYGAKQNPPEPYFDMARYYDAVHFAKRIRIPIIMEVGFVDTTIAPTSMMAAYNAITAEKQIVYGPLGGHFSTSDEMKKLQSAFINQHLGLE